MLELRKPAECPKCHGRDIRRILYGFPTDEAFAMVDRGEAVLGGCVVFDWMPDWECHDCRHRWFDPDDPAKQEMESLSARIQEKLRAKDDRGA
jgi:hypothetical protein